MTDQPMTTTTPKGPEVLPVIQSDDVVELQRIAYKTGYTEGHTDATDDGTGNGYSDPDAAEEGWGQYCELNGIEPTTPKGPEVMPEGPQPIIVDRKTCTGCRHLRTEYWKDFLENDETDSGTDARCMAIPTEHGGKIIASYWTDNKSAPDWCPIPAKEAPATAGRGDDRPLDRSVPQFFFEIGYGACWAEMFIRSAGAPAFLLTDAIVEHAWQIAGEAHEDPEEFDRYLAAALSTLPATMGDAKAMREALREMIYETTCLSPCRPDGSHNCIISAGTLERARAAYHGAASLPLPETHICS